MNTHKVTFENDQIKANLEISEETVLQGMRRTRLKAEASVKSETDPDKAFLAMITYPDLIATTVGTIKIKGKAEVVQVPRDLDFDTFLTLPGKLESLWEQEVYALNSHFLPSQESEEEEKKRPMNSTEDS